MWMIVLNATLALALFAALALVLCCLRLLLRLISQARKGDTILDEHLLDVKMNAEQAKRELDILSERTETVIENMRTINEIARGQYKNVMVHPARHTTRKKKGTAPTYSEGDGLYGKAG